MCPLSCSIRPRAGLRVEWAGMAAEGPGLVTPAIVLGAAVAGGLSARLLRMPTILGYISAGVAVSFFRESLGITAGQVMPVADIGVALLLFVVGIEFSPSSLAHARTLAFVTAPLQILLTMALGFAIGRLLGFDSEASAVMGYAIALSSTALAMKIVTERHNVLSPFGLATLSYALVQDLSLVVGLGILPTLAKGAAWQSTAQSFALSALALLAVLFLATRVMPVILRTTARLRNREIFMLVAVAICIGAAAGASAAGISVAVGAFLAGLIISESEYSHAVVAEVIPLRNLLVSVFFVSVGMLLNPAYIAEQWIAVLALSGAIILGKTALVTLLTRLAGQHMRVALTAALALCQMGEFSFIVAAESFALGLIERDVYDLLVSTTLVTMVLTPLMVQFEPRVSSLFDKRARDAEDDIAVPKHSRNHVILLGLGRVGKHILDILSACSTKVVVVDVSMERLKHVASENVHTLFGDAANPWILKQCRPEYAGIAIIAIPDPLEAKAIVETLRLLNP
ncbi:MAG: hypothetical protein C4340_06810, partial [Armatimonadota bacterium]